MVYFPPVNPTNPSNLSFLKLRTLNQVDVRIWCGGNKQ